MINRCRILYPALPSLWLRDPSQHTAHDPPIAGGTGFIPGLGHTMDGRLEPEAGPDSNGLYSVERQ